ncbi:MAG TPA: bifunctional oligoribonuclease/PAP phosphatase NrnA [Sedimentisphaerales bacterium]|nr:bifunctional oligoribonuclease/PAP phosphatase NrnA [Sedimentisphaerales bacterium]
MIDSEDFRKAVALIDNAGNVLITTHTRPDGDACGCVVAIHHALTALGKQVRLLFLSEIPEWYVPIFDESVPILGRDVTLDDLIQGRFASPDLVVIVDTNSDSQLPKFSQYLKRNDKPVLVIDHHLSADRLGDVELIDTSAAAAGLIVCDLLKHAGWQITKKIAHALFVAVAADTGWFQFTNTDSRTLRDCALLIDAGANPSQIYHDLYQNFSAQRFELMAAMLSSLELHFDGRYAAVQLSQQDFERTGAARKDTENLIDECRRIATVEVAALFVELPDGRIRCSLRSRGAVDVRRIAQKFDGGGHQMAAGTFLPPPLQNAKQLIKTEVQTSLP